MKPGHWMALPALAGLLCFVAVPFALAFAFSLTTLRLGSPNPTEFVGLAVYARVLSDALFWKALRTTCLFALLVVPLQTAAALFLAVLVNRPGSGWLRAVFFTPVVLPMALISVIWVPLYAPDGLFNRLLGTHIDFLHDAQWALPALILISLWQGVGLQMVVLLAGLQAIPRDLYEAAHLDGAGTWSQHRHVTLPCLRNALLFTALTTTVLAFRVFDQVQILTQGGPVGATTTLVYHLISTGLERLQVGQACALTTLFFALVLGITMLQPRPQA